MLTEEEKTRIRAEEIFRHEVCRDIEAGIPKHFGGKQAWSLLNSSFVLWFLSSVVLTVVAGAIAMYQKSYNEQIQKTEIQRRLNTEISSRIAEALVAMHLEQKRIETGASYFPSEVYNHALHYLNNRVTYMQQSYDFSIYPEYRQRGFRSLIFELRSVAERPAIPTLQQAEVHYKKLEELGDHTTLGVDYSKPATSDKAALLGAVTKASEILDRLQKNSSWETPWGGCR